jgi:hypothetical protein
MFGGELLLRPLCGIIALIAIVILLLVSTLFVLTIDDFSIYHRLSMVLLPMTLPLHVTITILRS